jgi:hypothetical protein
MREMMSFAAPPVATGSTGEDRDVLEGGPGADAIDCDYPAGDDVMRGGRGTIVPLAATVTPIGSMRMRAQIESSSATGSATSSSVAPEETEPAPIASRG